ncbi:MAG: PleD family two-component system response regulator [Alphaproteobacteria bacterium]
MSSSSAPTILVVEKDLHLRQLMVDFLSDISQPHVVEGRGYDALDRARKERPSLVITDVLISDLDGLALCRLIKNDEAMKHTKVLVISVISTEERAREAGADGFLKKPIEKKLFQAKVKSLLGAPEEKT